MEQNGPEKMSDRIYRSLREEIVFGDLRAGTILQEQTVAERFRVSKTPVRETLIRLHHDGFVETLPRRGYVVRNPSVSEVRNLFQIRALLEGASADLAARRGSDAEIDRMTELVTLGGAPGEVHLTPRAFTVQNRKFHLGVAALSGNPLLEGMVADVLDRLQTVLCFDGSVGNIAAMTEEHLALLQAIRSRNPRAARRLMEAAIDNTRRRVLEGQQLWAHD